MKGTEYVVSNPRGAFFAKQTQVFAPQHPALGNTFAVPAQNDEHESPPPHKIIDDRVEQSTYLCTSHLIVYGVAGLKFGI